MDQKKIQSSERYEEGCNSSGNYYSNREKLATLRDISISREMNYFVFRRKIKSPDVKQYVVG